jgi:predicted Zn-dependent protease with MMP-like domain
VIRQKLYNFKNNKKINHRSITSIGVKLMNNKSIIMDFTNPPSLDDIMEIAEAIMKTMPRELKKYTGKLKIEVEDFPDSFIEEELSLDNPFDIMGYYQSSLPSVSNGIKTKQDVLCLYRRPILDQWCETQDNLDDIINQVIINEISYHFGFSDTEVEMLEDQIEDNKAPERKLIICS